MAGAGLSSHYMMARYGQFYSYDELDQRGLCGTAYESGRVAWSNGDTVTVASLATGERSEYRSKRKAEISNLWLSRFLLVAQGSV